MALPIHDDAPTRRIPWVTYTLIVVNVVVFLFLEPASLQGGDVDRDQVSRTEEQAINDYAYKWGAIPCEIQHMAPLSEGIRCTGERDPAEPRVSGKVVLLSLLTAMFIHGSIFHLAGNMLFLWVFGNNVEDRLGPVPYLALYLLTGLVATFGHAIFNWDDAVPVLGASGAIAGVMGAYLVFRPRGAASSPCCCGGCSTCRPGCCSACSSSRSSSPRTRTRSRGSPTPPAWRPASSPRSCSPASSPIPWKPVRAPSAARSGSGADVEDELAGVGVRLHPAVRLADLLERVARVDHGAELA